MTIFSVYGLVSLSLMESKSPVRACLRSHCHSYVVKLILLHRSEIKKGNNNWLTFDGIRGVVGG